MTYPSFGKIPRLHKPVVVTEKLDGTNGLVAVFGPDDATPVDFVRSCVLADGTEVAAGSRNRWIHPGDDNYGFASWVWKHAEELSRLGPGLHYGEWWGGGIARGYGFAKGEKHFSLFNVGRWGKPEDRPACCEVVPTLASGDGMWLNDMVADSMLRLMASGSEAAPGYMRPEGVVVWHSAADQLFKATLNDDNAKNAQKSGLVWPGVLFPTPAVDELGNLLKPPGMATQVLEMAPA